jgi:predicted Zn-dependent protease
MGRFLSRRTLRVFVIVAGAAALSALVLNGSREPQLPAEVSDDTVVAALGSASIPYPAELRQAAARIRAAPEDQAAALRAARLYLDYGRAVGDARFAGAALGALQPWLSESTEPAVLNLAAGARQYMHDFDGALALFDRVHSLDPHNAQALLSRANILIVQGKFSEASADCISLARARRPDLAILCDTTAKALTREAPQAYEHLDRLVSSGAIDPALHGYARSLLAEIARFWNWPDKARLNFEAARTNDPDDLRTLMIFADFELSQGRAQDAIRLLKEAPATDGVMVRQAIASRTTGDLNELARLKQILRARFEAAASIGETAHMREAGRYWLEVEGNAAAALAAAEANWVHQKELEDALLLVAAASAAHRPDAALPVEQWAEEQGAIAPLLRSTLEQAKKAENSP